MRNSFESTNLAEWYCSMNPKTCTPLALLLGLLVTPHSGATVCSETLRLKQNPIEILLEKPLELSDRQLEILKNHPLSEVFTKNPGIRRIQLEPHLDPKEYEQDPFFSGELLQAGFLRSLLLQVGFKGKFMELHPRNFGVKHVLSLQVKDSAEYNPDGKSAPPMSPQERSRIVEMSDLKMANGKLDLRSTKALRTQYNIPLKSQVGHLYFNISNVNKRVPYSAQNPNFYLSAKKLQEQGANVIVVSSISRFRENVPKEVKEFLKRAQKEFDQVLFLSDVQNGKSQISKGTVVVLNDTVNQMPDIHKISDRVLVVGPINFFEALYSGTPTTVLINEATLGDYNRITVNKLLANGEDFPNFKQIQSLDETLMSVQEIGPSTYDYDAFTDFLDILYKKIINQMNFTKD